MRLGASCLKSYGLVRQDRTCQRWIATVALFQRKRAIGYVEVLRRVVDADRLVLAVLGMVAEMELTFIKERQRAGIDAAKTKGVYKGRPVTLDHAKVLELKQEGRGATEIAKALNCSRRAIYKILAAA